MAETYGTRPSELFGISEAWLAFCFDEALFVKHRLHLAEQRSEGGYRSQGFDPPPRREAIQIPWGGPGDDPLAAGGPS